MLNEEEDEEADSSKGSASVSLAVSGILRDTSSEAGGTSNIEHSTSNIEVEEERGILNFEF
ncbi:MAG: hypothetical protein KGQ87_01120 [Verrucomicrobia bacterium]|nr:hypothetical protein [Verrucomicrobiota bacterium]